MRRITNPAEVAGLDPLNSYELPAVARDAPPAAEARGDWWCPECKRAIDPRSVTYAERHDHCGTRVEWKDDAPPAPRGEATTVRIIEFAASVFENAIEDAIRAIARAQSAAVEAAVPIAVRNRLDNVRATLREMLP